MFRNIFSLLLSLIFRSTNDADKKKKKLTTCLFLQLSFPCHDHHYHEKLLIPVQKEKKMRRETRIINGIPRPMIRMRISGDKNRLKTVAIKVTPCLILLKILGDNGV